MKEFIDKLIERLDDEKQRLRKLRNNTVTLTDYEVCAIEEGAFNFCKKAVNELAEEYNNGWIPCKRELPKDDEKVLVIDENGIMAVCRFVESVNLFMVCWDSDEFLDAIAWQPLPAPYTEGEDELYRAKSVDGEYQEYKGDWK